MAVESPATFNQASTYGAEQTRRAVSLWASSAGGVKASGDLAVTAPVSGMTCNVATGEILVPGSSSAIQGLYYGRVSSTSNLAVAASNPSNPRIDMVYAAITDAAYTGATNTFVVAVATGTPTAGATLVNLTGAPALPTSAIILAYILVPATSTSVTTPNISDQRVQFVVSNAASLVSTSTQTFAGKVSTPTVIVTGITGAITQTRLVGGTASGAPISGTFAVNDVVPAADGTLRICTAAGSPGTFVQVGGSSTPANDAVIVATQEATTSTSFTDLATAGPAVTVTTGTKALVVIYARSATGTVGEATQMSFAISGATTQAAGDAFASYWQAYANATDRRSIVIEVTGLTAGSNTFTAKYRSSGGASVNFSDRKIAVINMGS